MPRNGCNQNHCLGRGPAPCSMSRLRLAACHVFVWLRKHAPRPTELAPPCLQHQCLFSCAYTWHPPNRLHIIFGQETGVEHGLSSVVADTRAIATRTGPDTGLICRHPPAHPRSSCASGHSPRCAHSNANRPNAKCRCTRGGPESGADSSHQRELPWGACGVPFPRRDQQDKHKLSKRLPSGVVGLCIANR